MKLEEIHGRIEGVIDQMICNEISRGLPPHESWEIIDFTIEEALQEGGELHPFKFMEKDVYEYAHKFWNKNSDKIIKDNEGYSND